MRLLPTDKEIEDFKESIVDRLSGRKTTFNVVTYTSTDELAKMTNNPYGNKYATTSIYGKEMDDVIIETNRLAREVERHISDTKETAKRLKNTPNGAKYSAELAKIIGELYNTKLSAIKAKADFITKKDKSIKEDLKMAMVETGGVVAPTNVIGNTNSLMNNIVQNDDNIFSKLLNRPKIQTVGETNTSFVPPRTVTPAKISEDSPLAKIRADEMPEHIVNPKQPTEVTDGPNVDENISFSVVEDKSNELNYNDILNNLLVDTETGEILEEPTQSQSVQETPVEPVENTPVDVDPNIQNQINKQMATMIVNAAGNTVPLYDEDGLDDFIEDPDIDRTKSFNASLVNIQISGNPYAKTFFKYNEEQDAGYLVVVDTSTNQEIPDAITHHTHLIYPWVIDFSTNTVSTNIGDDFSLLRTTDPVPDYILEEVKIAKERELKGEENTMEELDEEDEK